MNQLRKLLYQMGSWLGWINAVQRGTVEKRMARVILYKGVGKIMRKFLK